VKLAVRKMVSRASESAYKQLRFSPCYWCPMVRNRQIHKDLSVPLFALTASFGWEFPWFSSVVRQMPVHSMQSRDMSRTATPQPRRLPLRVSKKSPTLSFQLSLSGLKTKTTNQAKFIPPIISTGPSRRFSLATSVKALSLTSKSLA